MFYTSRLMLRGQDPRCDTEAWTKWLNDPTQYRAASLAAPKPCSLDETRELVTRLSKSDEGAPCFAVCLKPAEEDMPNNLPVDADLFVKDGKPRYPAIGTVNIRGGSGGRIDFTNRDCAMGIGLDEKYQGKGYGEEMTRWACQYAIETLGCHRIELESDASNVAALKCWTKCGFKEEGRRRKVRFQDGEWHDLVIFGMLDEEWWAMKKKMNQSAA